MIAASSFPLLPVFGDHHESFEQRSPHFEWSKVMNRREALTYLGGTAAALTALSATADAQDKTHAHAEHFKQCAKACADCMNICEACYHHCAMLATAGKKEHAKSMDLCIDCAEVCGTAAKLSARQSTLAAIVCEGCAKVCDECGASCEKFKDDKQMMDCAKVCKDCAKACRDMIKQLAK